MRSFVSFLSAIGLLALTASQSSAAITFTVELDGLANAAGTKVSSAGATGFWALVSDNLGDGIAPLTPSSSTAVGTYLNGTDDYVVFSSDLTTNGIDGFDQGFTGSVTVSDPNGTWTNGDPLYVVWFPDTAFDASPSVGHEYGVYTDPIGQPTSPVPPGGPTNPWITVDPSGNYTLTALAGDNFGVRNLPDGALNAQFVVPEPSGMVLMLGAVIFAALRRRRR